MNTTDSGLHVEAPAEGLWRAALASPKANILDRDKIQAFTELFERAARDPDLKAILIEGEGPHFSFGASVPEHLPGQFETMIPAFHGMFRAMLDAPVMLVAAVRGRCLGGALELISPCHRIFAAPDAKLGQPEIVLGVMAPVASVLLPERLGRARGEELCVSGRVIDATEARDIGLVDVLSEDPGSAARAYLDEHVLPRSAASLRVAVRAARVGWNARLRSALEETERIYLEELMATEDAVEGLQAFVDRREPVWRNR